MRRLRNINITKKLVIYLLVTSFLPLLLFGILILNRINFILQQETNKFNNDLLMEKHKNIELFMSNTESIIKNISLLNNLKEIISNENNIDSNYNKLAAEAQIGYMLNVYANLEGLISIDIFTVNGQHYHVGEVLNYEAIREQLKYKFFDRALQAEGRVVWNGLEDNINANSKYDKAIVISKAINVIQPVTLEETNLGIILLSYSEETFNKIFTDNLTSGPSYILIDTENRIIGDAECKDINSTIDITSIKERTGSIGSFEQNVQGETIIRGYSKFDENDWAIVGSISKIVLQQKTDTIRETIYALLAISFLLSILLVSIISRKYLVPVKKITKYFQELNKGTMDLNVRLNVDSDDEIGQLTVWFNTFLENLELKEASEKALLRSRDDYRKVINSVKEVIFKTDIYGKFIFLNDAWKEIIGFEVGESIGTYFEEYVYIKDREKNKQLCLSLLSKEKEYCRHKLRYITKDGDVKWIEVYAMLMLDKENNVIGFSGTLIDVTETVNLQNKLSEKANTLHEIAEASKNDFKRTVQNLQNMVFKLIRNEYGDFEFTLIEGRIAKKFGLGTEEVYGKKPNEVLDHNTAKKLMLSCDEAFKGKDSSFEFNRYDETFYVTLSPIVENDNVVEVVATTTNITELKEAEYKISRISYYDTVTELPNRVLFKERVDFAISHANIENGSLAIMYLDLDQFKFINDTIGHSSGDQLLKSVAKRLKIHIPKEAFISRMGGDEFNILIPFVDDQKEITYVANDVLEVFQVPFILKHKEYFITASVGISTYPLDGLDYETLMKNADMAMYRAKEKGRNNYQFYTNTLNTFAHERLDMERSLRKAIEKSEFVLFYQAKVDIKTGNISGSEALVRWIHPKEGIIPPFKFIPLAEETGLIVPMGEWILRKALEQNKKWINKGYDYLTVAVNISVKQFQQKDFVDTIKNILIETQYNPELLELEITESILMEDTNRNIGILNELKKIGIKISLDDFGTGYTSLSYIRKFAADVLKIDKIFIDEITNNNRESAITVAIINMANSLNLKVVAEGVETKEQLDFLRSQNCDEIQGYYFSKPIPYKEFEKMLVEGKNLNSKL
jgi:diguanylate cyclase (GGDEF)-like protein/PAS domain S-box-containing protein